MPKTLKYKVSINPGINRSLDNFKKIINQILQDPRSWNVDFVNDDQNYDFEIILAKAGDIKKYCGFTRLSCADMNINKIYINVSRWINGSKASKLCLNDYRIYVINHEVGHILGLHHAKPVKNRKVPVMNQSTLGIGHGKPNMWPLQSEQKKLQNN